MKQRILGILVVACMLAGMLPFSAFAQDPQPAEITPPTPTQEGTDPAPTLNEAQQAFVDAVAALNQEELVELAEAYKANPTEETDAAFYAEYDKADGVDGSSAAELYAALPDEDKAAETVAAANATLECILSAVNAILDPPEEGTPAPELTQGTEQATTYDAGIAEPAKDGDVYQITTVENLYWFAALVNGTDGLAANTAAKAILMNDITVNTEVLNTDGNLKVDGGTLRTWTPIGNTSNKYSGTFDGDNYTINGLYFNNTNVSYVGLFGAVGAGGAVQNVTVADSYIRAQDYVGGVCGQNKEGALTNCTNSGTTNATDTAAYVGGVCGQNKEGGTLTNCTNSGAVTVGSDAYAGGVCGQNGGGTLTNCTNSGTVTGTDSGSTVGGVCADNSGTLRNCTNNGAVIGGSYASAGGVCAKNSSTLENCYNTGTVTVGSWSYVGGVCSKNLGYDGDTATLTKCYNTGAVTGGRKSKVGGVCSVNHVINGGTATLMNCYNIGAVTGAGDDTMVGGLCAHSEGDKTALTNCYNTGALTGTQVGGVCPDNYGTAYTNCYYQAESETETDSLDGTTAKTAAQFASGEVAWLLDANGGASGYTRINTWAQDTASPKFAKADGSDVVYRALFLPKGGDTPVVGTSYLAKGAVLTAPAGYTWAAVPVTMPTADATYRWTAAVQITKQPTAPAAKTYGYTDTQSQTVAATSAVGKAITYRWLKNGEAIDGATAATYTIPTGFAAGSYVYTCEVTCDGDTVATTPVTFTVNKAPLTWDVSGLTAQKPYDGNTTATVAGTLKVSGALGNDDVQFAYPVQSLAGSYDSATVGSGKTVTVTVTGAVVGNANYTLPTGDIKITTGRIAATLPNPPQTAPDGSVLKLTVDPGIPMVPAALKNDPTRDTPAKIEAAMQAEAAKRLPGVPAANIITMDIELWYSSNGGASWTEAAQDKFPAAGVTVVVPYGDLNLTYATAQGMDFTVLHMISAGSDAGKIENLPYSLTQVGVQCTLHSLSPVTISYKPKSAQISDGDTTTAAATPAPTAVPAPGKFTVNAWVNVLAGGVVSPMGNTTCTEGQNLTYTITPAAGYRIAKVTVDGVDVGAVTSYTFKGLNRNHQIGAYFEKTTTAAAGTIPATGDTAPLLLWAALMALAAMGLAAAYAMRKKNHR